MKGYLRAVFDPGRSSNLTHSLEVLVDSFSLSLFPAGMIYSTSLNPSLAVSGVRGVDDLRDRSNLTLTSSPYSRPRNAGEVNKTSVRLGNVQYGECSVNLTFNASALSDRGQMQTVSKTCERGQWVYDLSGREATTVTDVSTFCRFFP